MKDYYQILEISKDATADVIRKQYRKLAKKYMVRDKATRDEYPDVAALADEKLKEVNEAYEVLSDSEKKAKYDDDLRNPPGPKPVLSRSTIDFGILHKGEKRTERFHVGNLGSDVEVINFNLSSDSSWFAIKRISKDPDKTFPIIVEVTADTKGLREGISYNEWIEVDLDSTSARVNLNVAVSAISAPAPTVTLNLDLNSIIVQIVHTVIQALIQFLEIRTRLGPFWSFLFTTVQRLRSVDLTRSIQLGLLATSFITGVLMLWSSQIPLFAFGVFLMLAVLILGIESKWCQEFDKLPFSLKTLAVVVYIVGVFSIAVNLLTGSMLIFGILIIFGLCLGAISYLKKRMLLASK